MQISRQNSNRIQIDAVLLFTRQMKPYRFENAPVLGFNSLDRCRVNGRCNPSFLIMLQMKPRSCKRSLWQLFIRQTKPHRFENAPLLAALSNRHGFGNSLDRCHVNRRRNRIENNTVTNETAFV